MASVISTASTPPSGPAIPASTFSYTAGAITKVGSATCTANDPGSLVGVVPGVTATGITGNNSAYKLQAHSKLEAVAPAVREGITDHSG